jgi:hypothetical protein
MPWRSVESIEEKELFTQNCSKQKWINKSIKIEIRGKTIPIWPKQHNNLRKFLKSENSVTRGHYATQKIRKDHGY